MHLHSDFDLSNPRINDIDVHLLSLTPIWKLKSWHNISMISHPSLNFVFVAEFLYSISDYWRYLILTKKNNLSRGCGIRLASFSFAHGG